MAIDTVECSLRIYPMTIRVVWLKWNSNGFLRGQQLKKFTRLLFPRSSSSQFPLIQSKQGEIEKMGHPWQGASGGERGFVKDEDSLCDLNLLLPPSFSRVMYSHTSCHERFMFVIWILMSRRSSFKESFLLFGDVVYIKLYAGNGYGFAQWIWFYSVWD